MDETIATVLSEVVGIFLFKEGFSLVDKMFLLTPGKFFNTNKHSGSST